MPAPCKMIWFATYWLMFEHLKNVNLPFWDFLRCLFHTSKIELGVFEVSPWLTRGSTSKMWIYIRKNLKNEHLHSWGQTKPQNVRWICSPATRLEIPYIKLCRCVEILDIIHYESMSHIYIYIITLYQRYFGNADTKMTYILYLGSWLSMYTCTLLPTADAQGCAFCSSKIACWLTLGRKQTRHRPRSQDIFSAWVLQFDLP